VAAVEAIYETAAAPARWPWALGRIADCFGDVGAVLLYKRDNGSFGTIVSRASKRRNGTTIGNGGSTISRHCGAMSEATSKIWTPAPTGMSYRPRRWRIILSTRNFLFLTGSGGSQRQASLRIPIFSSTSAFSAR